MLFYVIPAPDEVVLVSGRKGRTTKGVEGAPPPFRVVVGHGCFAVPPFRKARKFTLAEKKAHVKERCQTNEKWDINVDAVMLFHVKGDDTAFIIKAGQRYSGKEAKQVRLHDGTGRVVDPMEEDASEVFAGYIRTICGDMSLDALMTKRGEFEDRVLTHCKTEMSRFGLEVDSVKIKTIDDIDPNTHKSLGYIDGLAAPKRAELLRIAAQAEAEAKQASVDAEQQSAAKQAEAIRNTDLKKAEYDAEVRAKQALIDQAGFKATAVAEQETLSVQATAAEARAELTRRQLETQTIRPAEAAAEARRIAADGERKAAVIAAEADQRKAILEAEGLALVAEQNAQAAVRNAKATVETSKAEAIGTEAKLQAQAAGNRAINQAAAEAGRVSLEAQLIDQMPKIVASAASMYQGSTVTYLNGVEGGMGDVMALITKGLTLYQSLAAQLTQQPSANGAVAHDGDGVAVDKVGAQQ